MKATAEIIQGLINTDDSYKERRVQATVNKIKELEHSDDSTLFLDNFLIALCGYSWETIQDMRKNEVTE